MCRFIMIRVASSRTPLQMQYILHGQVLEVLWGLMGIDISSNLKWNTHVDRIAANAGMSLGFVKRNIKTKSLKSGKWHTNLLFIPSWSMLQQCGTPIQKKKPVKKKRSKDVQPGGPLMIMPEQLVPLHCCLS